MPAPILAQCSRRGSGWRTDFPRPTVQRLSKNAIEPESPIALVNVVERSHHVRHLREVTSGFQDLDHVYRYRVGRVKCVDSINDLLARHAPSLPQRTQLICGDQCLAFHVSLTVGNRLSGPGCWLKAGAIEGVHRVVWPDHAGVRRKDPPADTKAQSDGPSPAQRTARFLLVISAELRIYRHGEGNDLPGINKHCAETCGYIRRDPSEAEVDPSRA